MADYATAAGGPTASYGYTITPSALGPDQDLCNLLNARWDHSTSQYNGTFRKVQDWWNVYRAVNNTEKLADWENDVGIWLAFAVIQSDLARKLLSTFAAWPLIDFTGFGAGDGPLARKNALLVSAQLRDSDVFRKGYDFLLNADVFGTGIARVGWTH